MAAFELQLQLLLAGFNCSCKSSCRRSSCAFSLSLAPTSIPIPIKAAELSGSRAVAMPSSQGSWRRTSSCLAFSQYVNCGCAQRISAPPHDRHSMNDEPDDHVNDAQEARSTEEAHAKF
eukprot:1158599-Pelagomonas_calceolata.AAC.23